MRLYKALFPAAIVMSSVGCDLNPFVEKKQIQPKDISAFVQMQGDVLFCSSKELAALQSGTYTGHFYNFDAKIRFNYEVNRINETCSLFLTPQGEGKSVTALDVHCDTKIDVFVDGNAQTYRKIQLENSDISSQLNSFLKEMPRIVCEQEAGSQKIEVTERIYPLLNK